MMLTKLKITAAVLAVGLLVSPALADKPDQGGARTSTELPGVIRAVDAGKRTVTLHGSKQSPADQTLTVTADAKIYLDDGSGDRFGFSEGKFADLAEGVSVIVRLSPVGQATGVWIEALDIAGVLKAVTADGSSVTVAISSKTEPAAEKTFAVAKNVKIAVDDGTTKDKFAA